LAAATLQVLAQALSLEEALRAGEAQSPRLAAQRAMISSTAEQIGRAAELPDPKLRLGIENLPVTGPDRFRYDRDFMTMRQIGWAQEFPNGAKREARNLRAERTRDVEGANLSAQRAMLYRDIAMAWGDVYFAERMRTAVERLARQLALHTETVSAAVSRGRASAADGLMLRHAFEQANDRLIEQDRMVAKARIALGTWIGDEAKRPLGAPPEFAIKTAYVRASQPRPASIIARSTGRISSASSSGSSRSGAGRRRTRRRWRSSRASWAR
jgi:outer membrane protein TolC